MKDERKPLLNILIGTPDDNCPLCRAAKEGKTITSEDIERLNAEGAIHVVSPFDGVAFVTPVSHPERN